MAEAEAMQPATDRRTMHRDPVKLRQFQAEFIQGQIAPLRQTRTSPVLQTVQLARPAKIALGLR